MKRYNNLSVSSDHGVTLSHKVEIISNSCPGCILNQICPTSPNSTSILMTAYPNDETHLRWTLAGTCIRRAGWLLLHLRHGKRKFEWLCVWLQLWYNFSIECRISIATKWLCSFRGRQWGHCHIYILQFLTGWGEHYIIIQRNFITLLFIRLYKN